MNKPTRQFNGGNIVSSQQRLPNTNSTRGFSLLEILISIGILSVSLVALLSVQGNTMIASRRAEELSIATMLAKQQMANVELELQKDIRKGEFPDERSAEESFEEPFGEYRWRSEIRRIELPAPSIGEEGSPQALIGKQLTGEISKSVRELKLSVFWGEGEKEQSIEVVTHVVKL